MEAVHPTPDDISAILGRLTLRQAPTHSEIVNLRFEDAEYLDSHRLLQRNTLLPFIRDKVYDMNDDQPNEELTSVFFNYLVGAVEKTLALQKSA
jgi:hypothetical protein